MRPDGLAHLAHQHQLFRSRISTNSTTSALTTSCMDLPLHVVLYPPLKGEEYCDNMPNSALPYALGRVKMNPIVALQSFQN